MTRSTLDNFGEKKQQRIINFLHFIIPRKYKSLNITDMIAQINLNTYILDKH